MTEQRAKQQVVRAGKQLLQAGLIVRTWGNVSARISAEQFVITPSGRAYETLTTADIVTVNVADASHEGSLKPSSEKDIHAAVYRLRPDINLVIHTHQVNASVLSTLHADLDGIAPDVASILGDKIVCAEFALPTTNKLARHVAAAIARSEGKALLLASHGALCLGSDYDEAFAVAKTLETVCADVVMKRYLELTGGRPRMYGDGPHWDGPHWDGPHWDELRAHYVQRATARSPRTFGLGERSGSPQREPLNEGPQQPAEGTPSDGPIGFALYNSERCGDHFKLYTQATSANPFPTDEGDCVRVSFSPGANEPTVPPQAHVHRLIYERYKGLNAIVHLTDSDVWAVSQTGAGVRPLLDDFAQIVGTSAKVVPRGPLASTAPAIARLLRGRYAVMLEGNGALCCGPSMSDAVAVAYVMRKNCKAAIGASIFGGAKPIRFIEAALMRFVYTVTYSKRAGL